MDEDDMKAAAERYLLSQGYCVVARDYATRWAKLDFVCRDGAALAFVRVRKGGRKGGVKPRRAEREALSRAAAQFLSERGWWHFVCRFDVVLVVPDGRVELIRDNW